MDLQGILCTVAPFHAKLSASYTWPCQTLSLPLWHYWWTFHLQLCQPHISVPPLCLQFVISINTPSFIRLPLGFLCTQLSFSSWLCASYCPLPVMDPTFTVPSLPSQSPILLFPLNAHTPLVHLCSAVSHTCSTARPCWPAILVRGSRWWPSLPILVRSWDRYNWLLYMYGEAGK